MKKLTFKLHKLRILMGKSVFVPTILLSKSQMVKLHNGFTLQKFAESCKILHTDEGSGIETIENEPETIYKDIFYVIFTAVHTSY